VKEGEDKRESTGTETWGMKARTRQHNTEHTADRERERGGGGREAHSGQRERERRGRERESGGGALYTEVCVVAVAFSVAL
jgi:hypothetical protein